MWFGSGRMQYAPTLRLDAAQQPNITALTIGTIAILQAAKAHAALAEGEAFVVANSDTLTVVVAGACLTFTTETTGKSRRAIGVFGALYAAFFGGAKGQSKRAIVGIFASTHTLDTTGFLWIKKAIIRAGTLDTSPAITAFSVAALFVFFAGWFASPRLFVALGGGGLAIGLGQALHTKQFSCRIFAALLPCGAGASRTDPAQTLGSVFTRTVSIIATLHAYGIAAITAVFVATIPVASALYTHTRLAERAGGSAIIVCDALEVALAQIAHKAGLEGGTPLTVVLALPTFSAQSAFVAL